MTSVSGVFRDTKVGIVLKLSSGKQLRIILLFIIN